MKSSERFKETILAYLEEKASNDIKFKVKFEQENKTIDDCMTYVLNTVKNSGINGFEDTEIYGMALHYYDEKEVDIGGDVSIDVVVNHTVVLTEEEIAEQREMAKEKVFNDAVNNMRNPKVTEVKSNIDNQTSLF